MEVNFTLKSLLICLILYSHTECRGSEVVNSLVTIFVNIANEINRFVRLIIGRQDFNQWFIDRAWKVKELADDEYDFIIVGSGSAGSVIANRLSEVKKWKILLLEYGIQETGLMDVPVLVSAFQFSPYNWAYFMEKQKGLFYGLNYDRMHWPRGKALGGTTVINYMIYTRGNKWDYDRWAADGNPGWSYKDVLPYFLKSEKAFNLSDSEPNLHGTNGYQSVENIYRSKLTDAFIEAGPYVDLPHFDYNANIKSLGVAQIQGTVKKGRRDSTATAFLYPVRNRTNLHIIIRAFVTKILIDPKTKTAYGVEYEKDGGTYTVRAKKEVILSAGTFLSPQLLMLAGIGPKEHLDQLGIKVLSDLPVGKNLHDHLCFPGISFQVDDPLGLSPPSALREINAYLQNGTGPLTSLGGVEALAYIKTDKADYKENYPDMELIFMGGSLGSDYGLTIYRGMNIKDAVFDSLFRTLFDGRAWQVFPMLLHPKSTGYLKLKSRNPRDPPLFYGNFFSDPQGHDLDTFLAAIRVIQRIAKTPPFQKLGTRLNPRPMATCDHLTFDSDDYWRCCIKSISVTLHHQVGTAKMGPRGDPTAVVNPSLQVHGVKNLRVADCSIIPRALGAHTNAPAIMVGEKASDMIKLHWKEKIGTNKNIPPK